MDAETLPEEVQPVVWITGSGARRVGNYVARYLADRGYRLVLHANRSIAEAEETAHELTTRGVECAVVSGDVCDEDRVRAMVAEITARFERIDGLVNCSSIYGAKSLEETTAADVRRHFEVNALGTFLCCQQVGLVMVDQPTGGAIVNISDWAVVRPYANYAAYFASKGPIPTLTRDFAVELAGRNPRVRVNAVAPGPVLFPPDMPEEEREAAIAKTLLKRAGTPHHVAQAVAFLLENDFVTGVCLPVDGGRTIAPAE